jgi:hypothetical protein
VRQVLWQEDSVPDARALAEALGVVRLVVPPPPHKNPLYAFISYLLS